MEAELAKLSEQTPESKKSEIIKKTREKVGRFAGVFGLAATLTAGTPAMATPSPYEPLVDASGKTVLVLKEDVKGKEELFKLFDAEDVALYNTLPSEDQRKVVSYYIEWKDKKTNAKKFYKGIYNLMCYYRDIKIMNTVLLQIKKTGKLPDGEIPSLWVSAQIATNGFEGGSVYVKLDKANEFDVMIINMLKQEVAKLKKDINFLEWFLKAL